MSEGEYSNDFADSTASDTVSSVAEQHNAEVRNENSTFEDDHSAEPLETIIFPRGISQISGSRPIAIPPTSRKPHVASQAGIEDLAVTAALGLSRPKYIGSASGTSVSSRHVVNNRSTKASAPPTLLKPYQYDRIDNDALLDMIVGTAGFLRSELGDMTNGARAERFAQPTVTSEGDGKHVGNAARLNVDATPQSIVASVKQSLVTSSDDLFDRLEGKEFPPFDAGLPWGDDFDSIYSHAVLHVPQLCVDAVLQQLHVEEPAQVAADLRPLQLHHVQNHIIKQSLQKLHVAKAINNAVQNLLSDAPIVTLIREAVAKELAGELAHDDVDAAALHAK